MNQVVTPTGVLVLSADAPREAWLTERLNGITATDLPAIMGQSKYKTAIDVWLEKVQGEAPTFEPAIGDGEAALWGIQFEDVVARTWAEHKGYKVRRIGIIAHQENTWQRASLDRLVTGCPDGRCGLEVKTRSSYVGDEWDKGVPADVTGQVNWQLLVSGLHHMHVIALIGGQRLVEHVLHLDTDLAFEQQGVASIVWQAVQDGNAPKLPQAVWTDDYLEQLHPEREGSVDVTQDVADATGDYQAVLELIKDLEARKAELRTLLVGALGEHETATSNGRSLYSYKSSTTRRMDTKALAELHPDAAGDDRIYNTTTTRTLRVATTKEGK